MKDFTITFIFTPCFFYLLQHLTAQLSCLLSCVADRKEWLFVFPNVVRDTLKLDEIDFPFWLGYRNSLGISILTLVIKTRQKLLEKKKRHNLKKSERWSGQGLPQM